MSSPLKKTYNIVVNKTSVLPLLKWQTKQQREWHDLASKSGEDKRMLDRDNKDGGDAEVHTAFKMLESQRMCDILWIVQQGAGAGQERRQPDPLGEEGCAEEEEGGREAGHLLLLMGSLEEMRRTHLGLGL